jgi:hypothetical protein
MASKKRAAAMMQHAGPHLQHHHHGTLWNRDVEALHVLGLTDQLHNLLVCNNQKKSEEINVAVLLPSPYASTPQPTKVDQQLGGLWMLCGQTGGGRVRPIPSSSTSKQHIRTCTRRGAVRPALHCSMLRSQACNKHGTAACAAACRLVLMPTQQGKDAHY